MGKEAEDKGTVRTEKKEETDKRPKEVRIKDEHRDGARETRILKENKGRTILQLQVSKILTKREVPV